MSTWYELIKDCAEDDQIIECTLTTEELHQEFDDSFGATEGVSFTAWSTDWVYFPVNYDGAEWVGRAPRNPCEHKCDHVGGG